MHVSWQHPFYGLTDNARRAEILLAARKAGEASRTFCSAVAPYIDDSMASELVDDGCAVGFLVARRLSDTTLRRLGKRADDTLYNAVRRVGRIPGHIKIDPLLVGVARCVLGSSRPCEASSVFTSTVESMVDAYVGFQYIKACGDGPVDISRLVLYFTRDMIREIVPRLQPADDWDLPDVVCAGSFWNNVLLIADYADAISILDMVNRRVTHGYTSELYRRLHHYYLRPEILSAVLERFCSALRWADMSKILKGGVFPLLTSAARVAVASIFSEYMSLLPDDEQVAAKRLAVQDQLLCGF